MKGWKICKKCEEVILLNNKTFCTKCMKIIEKKFAKAFRTTLNVPAPHNHKV